MSLVLALLGALRAALRTRTDLTLENLALRQQLAMLCRQSKRPQFGRLDRLLWVWLSNWWAGWREALHVVRPETVIRWHRQGFRTFWTWKSRRGRGSTACRLGACGSRAHHGASESALGRATHPRRVAQAQARARRLAAHRCPAQAASPEATFSDLANVQNHLADLSRSRRMRPSRPPSSHPSTAASLPCPTSAGSTTHLACSRWPLLHRPLQSEKTMIGARRSSHLRSRRCRIEFWPTTPAFSPGK